MTARAVLDGIKQGLAGITPGPWANYGDLSHEVYPVGAEHDEFNEPDNIATEVSRLEDATFIAAAPTTVARLVEAVESIIAMHRIEYRDKWGRPATENTGDGGWCYNCGRFGGVGCPTVAAIENALGEGQ